MERSFEVGDAVLQMDSGTRMKIAAVADDGRFVCTWTRGPSLHRQKFEPATLRHVPVSDHRAVLAVVRR